ncbi:MAG: cytochrome c oxidase subunit II transmembrane domain-containing protein [Bacteroidia bacterium]|jgi:heme/copper-type cytochrome/quinol oxidase subunit 2
MFQMLLLDLPRRYQMTFQDTATPVMSAILDLHSYISFFLILILIFVAFQIFDVLHFFRVDRDYYLNSIYTKVTLFS